MYEPSIVVVCQGTKRGYLGDAVYTYDAQQFLVLSVPLPFESETIGWEARIIPWEYLLSAATHRIRPTGRLTFASSCARSWRFPIIAARIAATAGCAGTTAR